MTRPRRLFPLALASALAFAAPLTMLPATGFAQVGVSITLAPPALPIYAQPPIPGDGYLWQPGYWAWASGGYYWVPGTWVMPPSVGVLWTPGYWGWMGGSYLWHAGYWGPHVGFYGGINYGYGYGGSGYSGGRWDGGHFSYNRAANNFGGTHISNVYNAPVHNATNTRVSFNGGTRGTHAQPSATERAAMNEHHVGPSAVQTQHEQAAAGNHALFSSVNHGRPPVAATASPSTFTGHGVVGTGSSHGMQSQSAHQGQAATLARPETRPEAEQHAARPQPQSAHQGQAATLARPETRPAAEQHAARPQPQPAHQGQAAALARPDSRPAAEQHAARPQPQMVHAAPPQHAPPPQHKPQPAAAGPAHPSPAPAQHAAQPHPQAAPRPAQGGEKHEEEHH